MCVCVCVCVKGCMRYKINPLESSTNYYYYFTLLGVSNHRKVMVFNWSLMYRNSSQVPRTLHSRNLLARLSIL